MAAESCRERLHYEGTCSICLDYFTDPVTLDCGHNFCRICILDSWKESSTDTACPQCREKIEVKRLRPNRQLAKMIEVATDLSDLLKHRVVPVEDTAQECKDQICLSLTNIRKERKNISLYQAGSEEESKELIAQTDAEREKTASVFRNLCQFLEEQEKHMMAQAEEAAKEIAKKRDEYQASLSGEISSIDSLIQELEQKQLQSSGKLENLGDILERCQKVSLENLGSFPAAMEWRIYDFPDRNLFLNVIIDKFKESLLSGLQMQEVKVTLDPNTAHPKLIVSPDRKSVRRGNERQELPDNPERFHYWYSVLGREELKKGRYFWDVVVRCEDTRREQWAVGVATKHVWRKTDSEISPDTGVWDLGKWDGEYRVHDPQHNIPLFLSQEVKKIRVTLNCDVGQVAFFDADTGIKLYVYKDAIFHGGVLPFFFVRGGGHLTLLS